MYFKVCLITKFTRIQDLTTNTSDSDSELQEFSENFSLGMDKSTLTQNNIQSAVNLLFYCFT